MSQAKLQARFCRACEVRPGMRILVGAVMRFLKVKSANPVGDRIVIKAGKHSITLEPGKEVHVLDS